MSRVPSDWFPDSWATYESIQIPHDVNHIALTQYLTILNHASPLIDIDAIKTIFQQLALVHSCKCFIIHAGDYAKNFETIFKLYISFDEYVI